jgi:MFS family permease
MEWNKSRDAFEAVRIPEYRYLMIGRFLFITALRMLGTLVGWWIYNLTNDPFAIGLVGLAEVIPAISFSLYAGHYIDKSEKRKLLLAGVVLYLTAVIMMLLLSFLHHGKIVSTNWIALLIYAVVFCTGVIRAFTGPVFGVLVGLIVPRSVLQNATTWNQGVWLTASVTGHALCGFMIAWLGNTQTLCFIAACIVISIFSLFRILKRPPPESAAQAPTLESVKEGLRFVFTTKELLGALSLDLFAVLFGGVVAVLPIFARDILKVGAIGFGWLNAAVDIGAILMVIILMIFPMKRYHGYKMMLSVAGFGICILIFGVSDWYMLSFVCLVLAGMLDGVSVVVRGTIIQLKTPENMRGRVMSVNSMFINSSNELGQFESGMAARILGVRPSVIFGGCMTLIVVISTWFKAPALRKMEY